MPRQFVRRMDRWSLTARSLEIPAQVYDARYVSKERMVARQASSTAGSYLGCLLAARRGRRSLLLATVRRHPFFVTLLLRRTIVTKS
jgi:hypothetical protein